MCREKIGNAKFKILYKRFLRGKGEKVIRHLYLHQISHPETYIHFPETHIHKIPHMNFRSIDIVEDNLKTRRRKMNKEKISDEFEYKGSLWQSREDGYVRRWTITPSSRRNRLFGKDFEYVWSPWSNGNDVGGYRRFCAWSDQMERGAYIHHLVAIGFKLPSYEKLVEEQWMNKHDSTWSVDHLDFCTTNNNTNNLEVVTRAENTYRANLKNKKFTEEEKELFKVAKLLEQPKIKSMWKKSYNDIEWKIADQNPTRPRNNSYVFENNSMVGKHIANIKLDITETVSTTNKGENNK